MSKTPQNRSKTLLVLSWLSKELSWSILDGFWVRFGRVFETRGCVTNQACCHKSVCQGDLRLQVRSSTILNAFWEPTGVILALLWGSEAAVRTRICCQKKRLRGDFILANKPISFWALFKKNVSEIINFEMLNLAWAHFETRCLPNFNFCISFRHKSQSA